MRDLTRAFFKTALFILSLAGCTQSVTWLGKMTESTNRKAPATYRYNVRSVENSDENRLRYYNDYGY
jgi:hypothetical protein